MADLAPLVLFVPVSGPGGSGEYYRCLAIARALWAARPGLGIHFLLSRQARVERDPAFVYHELDASPTRDKHRSRALIEALRPSLVLFDCAGRMMHFRAARAAGARVAWLSDRPNKRRKGARWRMVGLLDLHLMASQSELASGPSLLQRLKQCLFPAFRAHFFSGIAPAVDSERRQALCHSLGLPESDYLLFAPGGGGYKHHGRPVPEIMLEAAGRAAQATGLACLMVMGPQYRGGRREHERVRVVDSLPTDDLSQLLAGARLAVIGGGSMMSAQALSLSVPVVMVPAGGKDQSPRIAAFSRRGLVTAADLRVEAIAEAATALASDEQRRQSQLARVRAAGIRNDVQPVAGWLMQLLDDD